MDQFRQETPPQNVPEKQEIPKKEFKDVRDAKFVDVPKSEKDDLPKSEDDS